MDERTVEFMDSDDPSYNDDTNDVEITKITKIPVKSKDQYDNAYSEFMKWCEENHLEGFSENILVDYFLEKAKCRKPSSLWVTYSMLKATLNVYHSVDISAYTQVLAVVRQKSRDYKPKTTKVFTREQIKTFLVDAPDDEYLLIKVVLIFGLNGICARSELTPLSVDDVQDLGSTLQIILRESEDKIINTVQITDCKGFPSFLDICRKYMALRPRDTDHRRFFIYYSNGKCTRHVIGKDVFGKLPSKMADYLKLPNPKLYTGRCFRRTSAMFANNCGRKTLNLSRNACFKSQFAEVYVENSQFNKVNVCKEEPLSADSPISLPTNSSSILHEEIQNEETNDLNSDNEVKYTSPQIGVTMDKEEREGDSRIIRPNIYVSNCKDCVVNIILK